MAKELTITGKIPLPEDDFDQAEMLVDLRDTIRDFESKIAQKVPFKFDVSISTPRPRQSNGGDGETQRRNTAPTPAAS